MHVTSGRLSAVVPFDFQKSMTFLDAFGPMSGEQYVGEGAITKAMILDGEVLVFRVRTGKTPSELDYELFSESELGGASERAAAERISFFLSLEDDIKRFYSIAEKDTKYYQKVKELWGLHHVKFPSLLEVSCWAIINQRIQRPIALRIKRSLVERYGEALEVDGRKYWAFPDYERLRVAKPTELAELTRNQRTAKRLGSLLISFGELDERFLRTAPCDKAAERLKRVEGIGDWSAQFILFRGLGRIERQQEPNVKPLLEMMKEVYGLEKTLDDINKMYGSWCGYWSLYLWSSRMAARTRLP